MPRNPTAIGSKTVLLPQSRLAVLLLSGSSAMGKRASQQSASSSKRVRLSAPAQAQSSTAQSPTELPPQVALALAGIEQSLAMLDYGFVTRWVLWAISKLEAMATRLEAQEHEH